MSDDRWVCENGERISSYRQRLADRQKLEADAALGRAVRDVIGNSPDLPRVLRDHATASGTHWFVHDILVAIANAIEEHPA